MSTDLQNHKSSPYSNRGITSISLFILPGVEEGGIDLGAFRSLFSSWSGSVTSVSSSPRSTQVDPEDRKECVKKSGLHRIRDGKGNPKDLDLPRNTDEIYGESLTGREMRKSTVLKNSVIETRSGVNEGIVW